MTLRLFSIICHEIIPFQGGKKKKSRVKHVAENALDIIIQHYHSLTMMSLHFHIISPCLGKFHLLKYIYLKALTQRGKANSLELLRLNN